MSYLKFQADNIFTGTEMLGPESVLVTDEIGIIHDIIDQKEAGEEIQKLPGIISPGFVNCHCHLELSHLKGVIPEHTGMVDFILNILQKRASSEEIIQDAIEKAEAEMITNGIVAVGDICNTTNTIYQKKKGNLYYHNFIEVSGFTPECAQQRFDAGLEIYKEFANHFPNNSTLAPHAPYSVSNDLFKLISHFSQNKISTIHNQESVDENEFFEKGTGDFQRLYKILGIDISHFKYTKNSSLESISHHLTQAKKTILVHNTFMSEDDITRLRKISSSNTQFYFCLCVLANRYITNKLPKDIIAEDNFQNLVVGTDSLASNYSLDILSEIRELKKSYPFLTTSYLLQFATFNGAKALGIEHNFGRIAKGKKPGLVSLDNGINTIKIRRLIK